jgi:MFS family permease
MNDAARTRVMGHHSASGSLPGLLAANVAFAVGLFVHGFLYNFYLERLGYTPLAMGRAQAALTAGGLLALLPAGRLVDRFGPRVCVTAAALGAAAGLAAGALVERALPIYASALLAGAAVGTWRVAGGPLMLRVAGSEVRARAFSWNVGLMVAAGGVLYFLAGAVPERLTALGWDALGARRAALLAAALATGLAAALYARLPDETGATPAPAASPGPAGAAGVAGAAGGAVRDGVRGGEGWSDGRLLAVTAAVFVWMLAASMTLPFFNLYFARAHGLSLTATGGLLGLGQVLTAAALLGSAELAQRRGPGTALAAWLVVMPPALLLLGLSPALGPAVALFVVQGFAPPATYPLVDQLVLERAHPARRGHAASWRNAATEASGVAGAWLGGALLAAASFGALFAAAGGVAAAGAVLLAVVLLGTTRPAAGRSEPDRAAASSAGGAGTAAGRARSGSDSA